MLFRVVWAEDKPDFSLANTYRADAQTLSLADYWMSEKYDGARALWNGAQLISRGGKAYAAPLGLSPACRQCIWTANYGLGAANLKNNVRYSAENAA